MKLLFEEYGSSIIEIICGMTALSMFFYVISQLGQLLGKALVLIL